ncbi:hydantoinase B/oxoprolinase family protein [Rhizobium leguminosarum bv. viciae]|uniref:hydantoinase B/oxoprolinase family protein n=1 Tax=Rhizobium leguminosarum TaxID=384 RepID=UPI00143FB590|nr:hydantoinase B/oxoprolinase family protein [Rhizobium leguminosarum]NKM65691.1 hydantoinase B/oxoprolinase family protein [Rhizobium leguminosarum bv. viciae]
MNVNSINSLPKNPAGIKVDPITLEIVRSGLVMAAEQVNVRIIRSAMNIVVKEMEDCSAAVFDCDGRLLSESASVPAHLNAIGLCLRTIMEHYLPLSEWKPGDVVLTNDPYAGGGSLSSHHTNDVIVYSPIFWADELVAIVALTVHHIDMGSMWMGCRGWGVEIEQEGIRFPPIKIVREGVLDEQLLSVLVNNTRLKKSLDNDLRAQISSILLAKADIQKMFERYGTETMKACFEELINYSERRTREEIRRFKNGVYKHEEFILEDGAKGGPFKIAVTVTVNDEDIVFDFTGTDPQIAGPVNSPLAGTYAATFYVMRCLTDPNIPNTEGSKRPIQIVAPRGTLVNAQWPAACNQRMVTMHTVVDLIFGALEKCVPERVMGDSCGCLYNEIIATDLVTGARVQLGEVVPGGMGATRIKDGATLACHVTNCPIPPIEVNEIECPVLYLERGLVADSGGAGRQRGGLAIVLSYEVRTDYPQLHHTSQKSKIPPQGVLGGKPGKSGKWIVNPGTPEERVLEFAIGDVEPVTKGDTITHFTPGGGGYGNPLERSVDAVLADVRDGFVSIEAALQDYKVRIDPKSLSVISVER